MLRPDLFAVTLSVGLVGILSGCEALLGVEGSGYVRPDTSLPPTEVLVVVEVSDGFLGGLAGDWDVDAARDLFTDTVLAEVIDDPRFIPVTGSSGASGPSLVLEVTFHRIEKQCDEVAFGESQGEPDEGFKLAHANVRCTVGARIQDRSGGSERLIAAASGTGNERRVLSLEVAGYRAELEGEAATIHDDEALAAARRAVRRTLGQLRNRPLPSDAAAPGATG